MDKATQHELNTIMFSITYRLKLRRDIGIHSLRTYRQIMNRAESVLTNAFRRAYMLGAYNPNRTIVNQDHREATIQYGLDKLRTRLDEAEKNDGDTCEEYARILFITLQDVYLEASCYQECGY